MKLYKIWILVMIGSLTIAATAFSAQVNFTPTLFLSEEYTDNLFLDSDDSIKVDEFITTVGLGLNLEALGRTAGMTLILNPSYNVFADNDTFDYWRYFGSLNLWNEFGRNTRLEFNSNYLETEDPRDSSDDGVGGDPTIPVDPTRRARNRVRSNFNALRLTQQIGPRSTLFGEVAYNTLEDIDVPVAPTLVEDYTELRWSGGLGYWYEQIWGLEVNISHSDQDYEERDDRTQFDGSLRILKTFSRRLSGYLQYRETHLDYDQETTFADYKILSPSAGIEYLLTDATNFSIGAGYYDQDFDNPAIEDDDGSFLEAEINNNWQYPRGYILLNFGSGYDIEDRGALDLGLQIYYQGYLEIGRNFTNRLSGEVNMTLRYDEYPNQVPERNDETIGAGVAMNYQALQWMSFRLSYDHLNVNSDVATEDYKENSVIFRITMTPSRPMRLN